jgi:serpin B
MAKLWLVRSSSRSLALAAALTLAACNGGSPGGGSTTEARSDKVRITSPVVSTDDTKTLASDNRAFAWDLYQKVSATQDNLVFSPASISIALAMAYGGAAGTTASQMATTLHFSLPTERLHPAFDALDLALESPPASTVDAGAFRLSLANAIWGQQGFAILPSYLDLLAENYGAGLQLVDFAQNNGETARLTINQWVSDKTAAKIPNLIPSGALDPNTRLVLTNAVYFKADWQSPFAPNSHDGTFTTATGPIQVPIMVAGSESSVPSWSGAGYHAAALPYQGGTTSMVLIVPDAGTFSAFEAALTAPGLDTILTAAPTGRAIVSMPRFKFMTSVPLGAVLKDLGMTDAFSAAADLSGIDGAHDLLIQDVLHQAIIAVDEKGTEAAAATAVIVGTTSVAVGEQLNVDRPFLFAIRDDATGAIVFLGRVLDPSK